MADNNFVHIVPIDDLREHEVDKDSCWCDPFVEPVDNGDFIILHNSLDRREDYETGRRKYH